MTRAATAANEREGFEALAATRLAEVGLRRTPRRLRLLALLLRERRPMTHQEIHEVFGLGQADRVSIYRALEAFVGKDLVHRAYVDHRTWMYESADRCGEDQCHPHFTCRACGRVQCLVRVSVPVIADLEAGYLAERQQVHITGLCPQCRKAGGGT